MRSWPELSSLRPRRFAASGALVVAGWMGVMTPSASGLIINNVAGTGSTPPANLVDPGFGRVGRAGNGTGIYLGNGYVMTANHVNLGSSSTAFVLDGVTYARTGPVLSVFDDGNVDTDLKIFRLVDGPDLPPVTLATSPIQVGDDVLIVGTGLVRDGPAINVQVNDGPPTPDPVVKAYVWSDTRQKAWGTSEVSSLRTFTSFQRSVTGFDMDFRDLEGEATAAASDSGSAIFRFNALTNEWELAGVPTLVEQPLSATRNGQPVMLSQLGDTDPLFDPTRTLAVDLSFYRDSIISQTGIPEPTTAALLALAGTLGLRRSRRA